MLDTTLQKVLEEQGKDELRNCIRTQLEGDYAHFCNLPKTDGDAQDYELAMYTLKRVFRIMQKAGIDFKGEF